LVVYSVVNVAIVVVTLRRPDLCGTLVVVIIDLGAGVIGLSGRGRCARSGGRRLPWSTATGGSGSTTWGEWPCVEGIEEPASLPP